MNLSSYQIIFCRNLLIYLHQNAQVDFLNWIKNNLSPQAILIVGAAETEIVRKLGFESILFPGVNAFKKKIKHSNQKLNHFPNFIRERDFPRELRFPLLPSIKKNRDSDKFTLLKNALEKANEGAFEEARQLCSCYLQQYGAHADIYYLLGLLHQTRNQDEEASICFHKAIYLEPSHSQALICLALLYESRGEKGRAELFRKRALKYL